MEGAANHSIKLHSTQPIKEINFFHFVDFHFVLLNEMEGIKMYYNSNLYEADSYLVIIIECFCEEWTNTWNWLRGELVAEYKGWMEPIVEWNETKWSEWNPAEAAKSNKSNQIHEINLIYLCGSLAAATGRKQQSKSFLSINSQICWVDEEMNCLCEWSR